VIRKQIYLQDEQQRELRSIASARGISEAEVIRQAIDAQRGMRHPNASLDVSAWEDALKLMHSTKRGARKHRVSNRTKWNRQQLYQDRLTHVSRPR
jgi:hypothetical protein